MSSPTSQTSHQKDDRSFLPESIVMYSLDNTKKYQFSNSCFSIGRTANDYDLLVSTSYYFGSSLGEFVEWAEIVMSEDTEDSRDHSNKGNSDIFPPLRDRSQIIFTLNITSYTQNYSLPTYPLLGSCRLPFRTELRSDSNKQVTREHKNASKSS